jgi:hypothetical protein
MTISYHPEEYLAANKEECQRKELRNGGTASLVMLKHMLTRRIWAASAFLAFFVGIAHAASPGACSEEARQYSPCEVVFEMQPNELKSPQGEMDDDLLRVEFRSPSHTTYMMRNFWDGGRTLRIRFTPIEPGEWTYKITSSSKRLDEQEGKFTAAETGEAGVVSVANLRHWRTTNKKPHLWLGAGAPWLDLDQTQFETWLDARKKDGFTHVRGTVLTEHGSEKPFDVDGRPDLAYFRALDGRILAAVNRGFTADLVIANDEFVRTGAFQDREKVEGLIRYVVARYGGLNVTWQGIEHFEDIAGARGLLRDIGLYLKKYDGFQHPRSTDARESSSPLLGDGWMNFIVEASPHPELAAVEHQFTQQPSVHVISTADPEGFRHELWNSTMNGEYPSASFEALKNEANVKVVQTWFQVLSDTRHWEFEPYFDVDGARAVGLEEVEYLTYAEKPGIVEINLPKHKYNPVWINPATGEQIPLKDYRGEVFSRDTPDKLHDWVLQVPREGHKEAMARSYYFESQDPPVQEPESDAAKTPFEIVDPSGDQISVQVPTPCKIKITKLNRATRSMQYVWWGDVVSGGVGMRILAIGASGSLTIPKALAQPSGLLNLRLQALNANGKAYELDRVYTLTP